MRIMNLAEPIERQVLARMMSNTFVMEDIALKMKHKSENPLRLPSLEEPTLGAY